MKSQNNQTFVSSAGGTKQVPHTPQDAGSPHGRQPAFPHLLIPCETPRRAKNNSGDMSVPKTLLCGFIQPHWTIDTATYLRVRNKRVDKLPPVSFGRRCGAVKLTANIGPDSKYKKIQLGGFRRTSGNCEGPKNVVCVFGFFQDPPRHLIVSEKNRMRVWTHIGSIGIRWIWTWRGDSLRAAVARWTSCGKTEANGEANYFFPHLKS